MAAIEMVNGDFIDRRFFIDTSCVNLHQQLSTLTWDDRYKENQTQHNDLFDAMLYAHRMSKHYWGAVPVQRDEVDVQEQRILDYANEQYRINTEEPDPWEQ
jgi:hypothetical protein